MRSRVKGLILVLALSAGMTAGTEATPPELISRDALFAAPAMTDPAISPDGRRLAYVARHEGVPAIWVRSVEDPASARPITGSDPVRSFTWAANGEQIVYGHRGDDQDQAHLRAVDVETLDLVELTPHPGVTARLLAVDRAFPDEVLVTMNLRDRHHADVHRVNTRTGASRVIFENTGAYTEMYADHDFVIRVVGRRTRRGSRVIYVRDAGDLPWYELVSWRQDAAEVSRPISFSRDGTRLFLIDAREHDTAQLYAYDTPHGRGPTYRHLWGDPRLDISAVIVDPIGGEPQAVAVRGPHVTWSTLDRSLDADWTFLQADGDGDVILVSRDDADRLWVIARESGDRPREHFMYDRGRRRVSSLGVDRTDLADVSLARKEPVTIAARDGLELHAYVTKPLGIAPHGLPMVLLVHDGPWSRATSDSDVWHQWLANRGYAVISVNYRGSAGFGKRFLNAGNREWSARMHDDLIDTVNWAVDQGLAHPDRVAIVGTGYGGYAALIGLTHTPGFFAAGVSIAGPADVGTWLEAVVDEHAPLRGVLEARVGRLDETAFLEAISPTSRAANIDRPLLIVSGGLDQRVNPLDNQRLVQVMQSKGLPVSWLDFPDERGAPLRPVNVMACNAIVEAFLSQHLGGRLEAAGGEVLQSTADVRTGADLIPGLAPLLHADNGQ